MSKKPYSSAEVECYSTNFLNNMLYARTVERKGKTEPVIHRSTGTANPPKCYAAWSDLRAAEEAARTAENQAKALSDALRAALSLLESSGASTTEAGKVLLDGARQALASYDREYEVPTVAGDTGTPS